MSKPRKKMTDGNVEKIRDILLGGVVEEQESRFEGLDEKLNEISIRLDLMDKRFEGIEDRLFGEVVALREQMKTRFSELEASINESDKKTAAKLRTMKSQESKISETFERKHQDLEKGMAASLKSLDAALKADQKATANLIAEERESILKLAQRDQNDLKSHFAREHAELRNAVLGRDELASVLSEMALRINDINRD